MKNKKKMIFLYVIYFLLIVVVGYHFGRYAGEYLANRNLSLDVFTIAIMYLLFILASFLMINIHEFGHFVFGKLLGYQLISYRIGFFAFTKENGKFKFQIIINKGYGGLCAMIAPKDMDPLHNKHMLFYAGGILFNLTFAALAVPFIFMSDSLYGEAFAVFFAIAGLISGLTNLIPLKTSGNNWSDGKIIWGIITKKEDVKSMLFVQVIMAQMAGGIRPRDLEILSDDVIREIEPIITLFDYYQSLDRDGTGNLVAYSNLIVERIKDFSIVHLPGVYYELIFIGCVTGQFELARTYYEKAKKTLEKDLDVNGLRVKAYYQFYCLDDKEKALEYCTEALKVVDKFPSVGQAIMEEGLIRKLMVAIKDTNLVAQNQMIDGIQLKQS